MARTFRSLFRWLLPGNYHTEGSDGQKVLHSLSLIVDAFDSINRERLTMRFPSYAGESALARIGGDRGIPRGRSEVKDHYANRLIAWRYPRGHRVRGNAFALLEQIWEYFGGGFALYTEQANGIQFRRAANGTETVTEIGGWDWDSLSIEGWTSKWSRGWIVIDGTNLIDPTPDYGDPSLYGGQHGDSSYALGHVGISADDVTAIRKLFRGRAWKMAGSRAMWAILSFDGSAPVPEGAWGLWARDDGTGNYEAARPSIFRYWALDPTANLYSGDPAKFPRSADMPGGGTYAGDPTGFAVSSALPGGFTYAGNPASWPTSATLVDDGSIP
jgi:hypothetical protein